MIGTGASAIQLIPAIADDVGELLVFQRTPNWLMPTPQYYAAMPDEMQWLLANVPVLRAVVPVLAVLAARRRRAAGGARRPRVAARQRLGERAQRRAAGDAHAVHRDRSSPTRPSCSSRSCPDYPPLAKRILLDNGIWAATLKRDHVHLVSDAIERDHADGVVTADGREHEVDVIVYATGFEASRFLTPMKITGRDGRRPARALGRRRARLSRRHGRRLPEPVLPLRPEHEPRRQRQHHLLLRVRGALHRRLRAPAPRARTQRALDCRADGVRRRTTRASTTATRRWRGARRP